MITPEEEFSRYHKKLRHELNVVHWHFSVLKYIKSIQNNYLRELNQAPAFWSLTINAHLNAALTRLNNFFDNRRQTTHLHMNSFLDFVEQNLDIFSNQAIERRLRKAGRYDKLAENFNNEITTEKVEQDRQKLKDLPISNLRKWRNEVLAHIDKDSIAQEANIAKEYPIKIKHVDKTIDTLHEMLNEYCLAYDFSSHSKDLTIEHGIQYIVEAVRFKLQG